tara:strand:- start:291 stop:899 length:609 start_codon:yes stop_codon:yes gene_type:complete
MRNIILLFSLTIFASSCASTYLAPNGKETALRHKKLAVIMPKVTIEARKKVEAKAILESQISSATEFQQELYKWVLKRKDKGQFVVDFQDVSQTNALLRDIEGVNLLSTDELCKLLNVDGIIISNFGLSKPMSPAAAIASTLLIGFGVTNEVAVSISIKDCTSNSLLWKYDHKYQGGLFSSPAQLVNGLMRDASKKMPYFKK